jgi:hypothetical protein
MNISPRVPDTMSDDTPAIRAAREEERRFNTLEAADTAILGHCERIEEHLRILNGKTATNADNITNVSTALQQHLRDIETSRETERLEAVEFDVSEIKRQSNAISDRKEGQRDVLSTFDKMLIRVGPLGGLAAALYAALK